MATSDIVMGGASELGVVLAWGRNELGSPDDAFDHAIRGCYEAALASGLDSCSWDQRVTVDPDGSGKGKVVGVYMLHDADPPAANCKALTRCLGLAWQGRVLPVPLELGTKGLVGVRFPGEPCAYFGPTWDDTRRAELTEQLERDLEQIDAMRDCTRDACIYNSIIAKGCSGHITTMLDIGEPRG